MIIKALLVGGIALTIGDPPIRKTYRIHRINGTKTIPDDEATAFREVIDHLVTIGWISIVKETSPVRLDNLAPAPTPDVLTFNCSTTEAVNDLVYISGDGEVAQADASDPDKIDVVGHIVEKPTSTTCKVSRGPGPVVGSGLTAGVRVWLSDADPGKVVQVVPSSPSAVVQVGIASSSTRWVFTGVEITT